MPSQGVPGIFIQKLAELTEWQRQQQENLLREQETQRQILSKEQRRMCDVYGTEHSLEPLSSGSKRLTHLPEGSDGLTMDASTIHVPLDDVPFPLQKKNFNDFLQEKLCDDTSVPLHETGIKPKKPFLRKGQGLARFRLNPDVRPRPTSSKRCVLAASNKNVTSGKRTASLTGSGSSVGGREVDIIVNGTNSTESRGVPIPTWAHVLSQRHPAQLQGDVSIEKRKREQEELRVFELLEQKAANSSFCSTSSAIAQLMSKSVQSTPIKTPRVADVDTSLHVRFADTDDYKNLSYHSDSDSHGWHQEASLRERAAVTPNTPGTEAHVQSATGLHRDFRDSSAWSDDDSCESSSQSESSCSADETVTPAREEQPESGLDSLVPDGGRRPTGVDHDSRQDPSASSAFLFKSDLLRTRLQELENEIETFRKENAALSKLRRSHELEVLAYRKEKKEAEKRLKEEEDKLKIFLESEKKKLAKEKLVYERYCRPKELKHHPSKAEREEIAALKIQVEHLRDELVKKDGRWGATQVRTRDRLRQLEGENSELKKQIQNLKRERQEARQFKIGLQNGLKASKVSNTKVIHAINNHIGKIKPKEELKNSFVIKNVIPKKPIPRSIFSKQLSLSGSKPQGNAESANLRRIQSVPDMGIVSSSLENVSRSAGDSSSQSDSDSEVELIRTKVGASLDRMRKTMYDTLYPEPPCDRGPEAPVIEPGGGTAVESLKENGNREKAYEDGRKETWYPNGNVKKVSSDRSVVKMIYFNGDVKETQVKENVVKYYYAETRTWHTSYPDGQEILEFPNGQVERRSPDGSTQITFSNGCVRVCHADGRDEWAFPDGTKVNTTTTGDKVVQLSNGQREVHTLEHKRREYPDGTVKLVYPDGLQETRYANGRIRLRDKDGNLILDSAAEN